MLSVVNNDGTTETGYLMDDIVREGAGRMLAAALEAEVDQYIAELAAERDETGRRLVVRNGHHRERTVATAAAPVAVKAPRVNDKRVDAGTGERRRFSSKILAPWCRKSPKVSEVLPLLYLHGLSYGDFVPAMKQFLGSSAGLSVHKVRNVMNALPKSAQPGAKKALQEIYNSEDRDHAEKAVKDFERAYGVKWPKAAKKVTDETDEFLALYDFPAEHWVHLRTTNPIESAFSTVKLRTKVTRGAGTPVAPLAMVFKLESAQARWRAITAPKLIALGRAGARFENGHHIECSEARAA
ncbi:transposase [Streptomyces sp. NPDC058690]|uniref:transposase n=1 Tax=Streptomyces sp. NPDC058690 TaxID=3346600 RepID=UPI00366344E7